MKSIKIALPDLKKARNRRKEETQTIEFEMNDAYRHLGTGKTYHVFTYGCQGNEADSEVISGILENMGYSKIAKKTQ
jgi:tRNA-2-methylthio-N6-dimethylallyladenosine synthase